MSGISPTGPNKFWIAVIAIILAVIVVGIGTFFAGSYMEQREEEIEYRGPNE